MTTGAAPTFRTVSFGDLDGRSWGAALDVGLPAIVYGVAGATGSAGGSPSVRWSDEGDGDWRLIGNGFELVARGATPGAMSPHFDELCQVSGTVVTDNTEHPIECAGTRSFANGLDARRLGSVRGVCAWFDADHAVSLLALRSRDRAGQEGESIAATVFEPEGAMAVAEPRLSTTYAAGGRPLRAGLELWVGEAQEPTSRRTAAEASGAGAELDVPGLQLIVTPLRCHSRGRDGPGVYLLARL